MSTGTLIFLILIAGSVFAMFAMHRGGHASGSTGGGGGCGGHNHGGSGDEHSGDEHSHDNSRETDEHTPLLGPPGTQAQPVPATTPAGKHRHRGC